MPLSSWAQLLGRVWIRLAGLPHSPHHPQSDRDSICSKKLSECGEAPLSSPAILTSSLGCRAGPEDRAVTKDRAKGGTVHSDSGLQAGAGILQAQRAGRDKGHNLRPAGRWARTVAGALGGEAGQEGRTCWDGLHAGGQTKGMHSSRGPQGASEGVLRPRHPSGLRDRLEARKEAARE